MVQNMQGDAMCSDPNDRIVALSSPERSNGVAVCRLCKRVAQKQIAAKLLKVQPENAEAII